DVGPDRCQMTFSSSFRSHNRERAIGPVRPTLNHAERSLIGCSAQKILARKVLRMRQRKRQLTRQVHRAWSDPPRLAEAKRTGRIGVEAGHNCAIATTTPSTSPGIEPT